MSVQSKSFYIKLATLVGVVSGVVTVISSLVENNYIRFPLYIVVFLFILFLVKYYDSTIRIFNTARFNAAADKSIDYLEYYRALLPSGTHAVLNEYISNSVIRTKIFQSGYRAFVGFSLIEFRRSFKLFGKNITTNEYYKWENEYEDSADSFNVVQFGGSIPDYSCHEISAREKIGRWTPIIVNIVLRAERGYIANLQLSRPVMSGEIREVEFNETWPDAMLENWDLVLFPQACYYGNLKKLHGEIVHDTPVGRQFLCEIDVLTSSIKDRSSLIKEKKKSAHRSFYFNYEDVLAGKVLYWIFERLKDHVSDENSH